MLSVYKCLGGSHSRQKHNTPLANARFHDKQTHHSITLLATSWGLVCRLYQPCAYPRPLHTLSSVSVRPIFPRLVVPLLSRDQRCCSTRNYCFSSNAGCPWSAWQRRRLPPRRWMPRTGGSGRGGGRGRRRCSGADGWRRWCSSMLMMMWWWSSGGSGARRRRLACRGARRGCMWETWRAEGGGRVV